MNSPRLLTALLRCLVSVLIGIAILMLPWEISSAGAQEPAAADKPLPGLLGSPQKFPGIGRWQLASRSPQGWIKSVAWSPDGRWIALADVMHVLICTSDKLEDARFLVGHTNQVTSIAWSPDSKQLVSASFDKTVRLWKSDGTLGTVLTGHTDRVNAVCWSRDGQWIASASDDGTIHLWGADGKPGAVITGHEAPVLSVAFSPDSSQLVAGDLNRAVRFWNVDGTPGPALEGHHSGVYVVAWSPDGKMVASSGPGYHSLEEREGRQVYVVDIRLWSPDGKPGPVLGGLKTAIYGLAWTPDSSQLVSVDERGAVRNYSAEGKLTGNFSTQIYGRALSLSPDGQKLVVTGRSSLATYTMTGGRVMRAGLTDYSLLNYPIAGWSPDGTLFASAARSAERLRLWRSDGSPGPGLKGDVSDVRGFAWSPDGKQIVAGRPDGLRIWNADGSPGIQLEQTPGFGSVWPIAWNPDGKTIVAASRSTIQIWNSEGKIGRTLDGHTETVEELVWTRDGARLASSSRDGTIRIWEKDGTAGPVWEGESGDADSIAWSADGKKIYSGFDSGYIAIWNIDGTREKEWYAHEDSVMSLAVSPDGRRFASAGWDELIRIWNADGTHVRDICGHWGPLFTVSWSPDGDSLVATGWDGTVRVWSAETGASKAIIFLNSGGEPQTLLSDGRLVKPNPEFLEQKFYYLVETPTGAMETLSYSEFQKRTIAAAK